MRLAPILVMTVALAAPAFAGEHQYIALPKSGQGVILWSDRAAATNCGRATLRGTDKDRRELCEDGVAGGAKPKVGLLEAGTEVERLDPRACGDLVQVRVLEGPVSGGIGCISGGALTNTRPQ